MMAIHKISDDFYEDSYTLVALRSSMADYAMAFALNKCLKSSFKRCSEDLEISKEYSFPIFEWKDTDNDQYWTLITNKSIREEITTTIDLFENEPSFTTVHVVPEHKDADYLLKIEHDEDLDNDVAKLVQSVPKVIAAYQIDIDNLKSKTNLIF